MESVYPSHSLSILSSTNSTSLIALSTIYDMALPYSVYPTPSIQSVSAHTRALRQKELRLTQLGLPDLD